MQYCQQKDKELTSNYFILTRLPLFYLIVKIAIKKSLLLAILSFITFSSALATKQIQEVNYFSSLRANETNVRSGPGQNYPIKFTYKVKGVPVRVISEYDNWNEIEDYDGHTGWVTQSLLTKKRTLMVYSKKPTVEMRRKKGLEAHLIYRLENFVIGEYVKCEDDWCIIKINGKKGWVEKADIFGVESQIKTIDQSEKKSASLDQQPYQLTNNDALNSNKDKVTNLQKNQVNIKANINGSSNKLR